MTYTIEIDACNRDRWTDLLPQFSDASIYQTWSYGAIRWGESSLSHIIVSSGGEVVGIAQVIIKKLPLIKAGIAYVPWGPLVNRKNCSDDQDHMRSVLKAMVKEYVDKRGLVLRLQPNAFHCEDGALDNIIIDEGFAVKPNTEPYRTMILDITPPLEYLRMNLKQKWRNMLNQAERKNLTIVEGASSELYELFHELLTEVLKRKKFEKGVNYEEFRHIQDDLPEQLKMNIMICVEDGQPVAGAVCSAVGSFGIYMFGATGDKGLSSRGSYLLQWRMIERLKNSGYKLYDLGGINPERNPGVYTFKSGLSGKDVSLIGPYELCRSRLSWVAVMLGDFVRKGFRR